MEVSSLLLLHKKNVDSLVASFGLPVTASITTHSSIILAWIHVLSCDSLFTGMNQRECLLHHPLGISGIKKKKLFFSTLDCVSSSSCFWGLFFFVFPSNINRNWFLSYKTAAFWRFGVFLLHNIRWWQWCCQERFPEEMGGLRTFAGCGGPAALCDGCHLNEPVHVQAHST